MRKKPRRRPGVDPVVFVWVAGVAIAETIFVVALWLALFHS